MVLMAAVATAEYEEETMVADKRQDMEDEETMATAIVKHHGH